MGRLELYRKRLIPNQNLHLKDDEILFQNDNILVTRWKTIHQKETFDHGVSCYFLGSGIKLSKFYRADNTLFCWYCDIVDYEYDEVNNRLTVWDLLADVKIFPDGHMRVMDLDELSEAFKSRLISEAQLHAALNRLDFLLSSIESGDFETMKEILERHE